MNLANRFEDDFATAEQCAIENKKIIIQKLLTYVFLLTKVTIAMMDQKIT